MALLTTQQITAPRLTATYGAVASSDTIYADSVAILMLHVKNGSGSTDTVTITDPGSTPAGSTGATRTATVAAGGEGFIPLQPQLANSATGLITVTHSVTTSVTCAVLRND